MRACAIYGGAFDIDGTMIEKFRYKRSYPEDIEFDYYGTPVYARPLLAQAVFMKCCHSRGQHILVWSANGSGWAEEVIKKLGLEDYVDFYMDKPVFYVDDNAADTWMKRIMIDDKVQE